MPRAKKTESDEKTSASKKTKSKAKPKTKKKSSASSSKTAKTKTAKKKSTSTKKTAAKKSSKKKAKPIIVDVISDEQEEETFFPDESLEEVDDVKEAEKFFLNLEEGDVPRVAPKDDSAAEKKETKSVDEYWEKGEEVDKQKQFFSDLVTEIKKTKGEEKSSDVSVSYSNRKKVKLYRSLAWKFLVLVGFLALVVFYFSFSKLTISVTPEVEAMSDTLFLKVANQDVENVRQGDARERVSGAVNELKVEVEKTYKATGEQFVGEEIVGEVRIINNYSSSQPLVVETRLFSPDQKLFRIKEAVNVPAGGEVEVDIKADEVSRDMAIAPTRFTIPGLWVGLQDKIYAVSDQAFSYTQKMNKYVKASDVQLAESEAYDLILAKAKELKPLRSQDKVLYKILEPVEIELTSEAGDETEEFTMKATATVVTVSFSQDEVERLAQSRLNILIPDDKRLSDFDPSSLSYVLENYNEEDDIATIKATFSGLMVLKSGASVIDKERLVNLKEEQIRSYLKNYREISSYDLEFYPSFIQRAPHLVDRIEIEIKK